MRQTVFVLVLIIASLLSLAGYCLALLDWVNDVQEGIYQRNHLEAVLETSALALYTYLGIRFTKNKINV